MLQTSVTLPYGKTPRTVRLPADSLLIRVPKPPQSTALADALTAALDAPVDSPPLETLVRAGDRVLLVVSDATRDEPRGAFVAAVRERLPGGAHITVAIANGTHAPGSIEALNLGDLGDCPVVNHDGRDQAQLVTLGKTRRGTPVRVNRCLLETDVAVLLGQIKPHYFAGFGAGAKALFPGLGGDREVRINHRLKSLPESTMGRVLGNPCRDDLEEAAAMMVPRAFLLNTVVDEDGGVQGAFAGDLNAAFRRGAALCRRLYLATAERRRAVVVSDCLPVTESLYQASKLVAAAAELLREDGVMIVVAECPGGVGPLETVNRDIYELGLRPRLPQRHRILLVSSLPDAVVRDTYCEPATWDDALANLDEAPVVLPRASTTIVDVTR